MKPSLSLLLTFLRWAILGALLVGASMNQFTYSLKPLWQQRSGIPQTISLDDASKLKILAPDIFAFVQAIASTPPQTRFYFVPSFNDSENTGRDLGLVISIARYFGYPRIILGHDEAAYSGKKSVYLEKFIGKAKTWKDVDWISSRNIQSIILIRHNKVSFSPITAEVPSL